MSGGSWPPSFLLPSSPTLWMWPVLMSTKLLHNVCAQDTFLFVFFPVQMHACGQGKHCAHTNNSSLTMQQMPDTCFFHRALRYQNHGKQSKTPGRQTSCKSTWMALKTATHVQTHILVTEGHKSTVFLAPYLVLSIFSALDCIYVFECCWDWQVASSSSVLFPAVPQWDTWALTTKLQQTFPEDESEMSTAFGT